MNIVLFGGTGMVGQGVLAACLADDRVRRVVVVTRRSTGATHPKVEEVIHEDFLDFHAIEDRLVDLDACFFCLGISSAGMREAEYTVITYDFPLAAARVLVRLNPAMVFCYVSGQGTDSTERGRTMWARVKGRAENDLLKIPFRAVYLFRPGYIQPMGGIRSRTALYRFFYAVLRWVYPLAKIIAPDLVTTTETLGRSMITAAAEGATSRVIAVPEINRLGV